MNRFDTLDDWLAWQETLNPAEIDLGLDRLQQVMQQASIPDRFNCPLIMVAGTNGKGSTIAFLDAIATANGYKVASYTSPHLLRYNERIRINGAEVTDDALCSAFQRVDDARADVPLTYFEFGTLAAIDLFHGAVQRGDADLVLMEIGLGGRLDAVNVMQPDVSIITGIALDHTDWLGDTREAIAREKAGVMRQGRLTVIGDCQAPQSLYDVARETGADTLTVNRDVILACSDHDWSLMLGDRCLYNLPAPSLGGEHQLVNAACAITALMSLPDAEPVESDTVAAGLQSAAVAGRLQRIELANGCEVLLDVAHNPQAVSALVDWCKANPVEGEQHLVIAMLRDKPVDEVCTSLCDIADAWCVCGLDEMPRGLSARDLAEVIRAACSDVKLTLSVDVQQACASAVADAGSKGRVIVTGSFYTVADAMRYIENQN